MSKYLNAQPVALQNNGQHESMAMKTIRKCSACNQATLVLKKRPNNQGFYITCNGFPRCRNTYWLPPSVTDAQVSDNICSQVFRCNHHQLHYIIKLVFFLNVIKIM